MLRLSPSTHWQTNPAQTVASPSAQSSNLFQNAAGFSIVGGQFVSGDVHNHPGEGKAHGHFPNPRNNSLPIPSFNILDDSFSESEIYCNQLMRRRRGFPLYVPGPPENLPEEYRRHGVAIGDVGSITPEGIFDFYFNVYLPADHPINDNDVPEDFCPLIPYTPKDLTYLSYDPGDSVSTSSVAKLTPPSEEFPGGDFAFRCDAPQGAVLALPHGAHLKKLKNLETLREYAAFHAESWYKYINGTGGRGLQNGSLYLVTGCEKAHSWGMASFYGTSDEFQLKFSQMPTSNRYRWRGVQGSAPSNQTTFIHGLSISLGVGIWGKLFGTKVGIREIVESRLGGANGYGNMSQPSGSSSFSWSLGLFGGGRSTGGKSYAGENRNVVLSDFPPVLKAGLPVVFSLLLFLRRSCIDIPSCGDNQ
ncbi:hypothetical protein B0H16DRAFT_971951 [Mycena metata]|uniref:Uncharacterized protein n=1 Tax=Mycena metata TaxID=1033252 RepID=A0AAD7IMU9_9AGAR|nr:hypothetical protein B0H16DRAFT_971951 [Mycena metata]